MSDIPIALQMYTVRDVAAKDFIGALRQVAEIGYAGVELAGTFGLPATELKAALDDLGLKVAGSHVALAELESNLPDVIEYNRVLNNPYIVLPAIPQERRQTLDDWRGLATVLNRIGREIKLAGMQFCYHNHAVEFEIFDGKFALEWLYELTDPDLVKAEIDTYWVQYAGQDPAEYLRKYADRMALVHLKDMEPGEERFFAEVGEGVMNWEPVFRASEEAGVQWYIVEQDRCRRPSMESARISFENLKRMGRV
ncbi:MAG: sugar phosphate isomerase/epimerase [Anaerolineae bacterium]|nr:sugar phosphate isomerase/epimerase [Anaerolineae bacterium]